VTGFAGALEAVDRILNRGGDADDVLRDVLAALHERGVPYAAIRFREAGLLIAGPSVGERAPGVVAPVVFQGKQVGELELGVDDRPLAERVAVLISPYVLVGWDTAGEPWEP
jgi:hypothetical protein